MSKSLVSTPSKPKKSEDLPTCTASQVRIPIFAPTSGRGGKRKKGQKADRDITHETITNSWGTATITGRLTQLHRTILDILLSGEYQQVCMQDGGVVILGNVYGVLRRLGFSRPGNWDVEWLKERFEELRVARLTVKTKKLEVHTGIVAKAAYARLEDESGRRLYAVVLTPEYVRYCQGDQGIHWSMKELEVLVSLPAGVQAVARFMRSHKAGTRYRVDTALSAVGISREDISDRAFRQRRQEVREAAPKLRQLGMVIEGDSVCVERSAEAISRLSGSSIPTERKQYPDSRKQYPDTP